MNALKAPAEDGTPRNQPQPAAGSGTAPRGRPFPPHGWAVFIRNTTLPLCDAVALSIAALLVDPIWPAAGYVVAVLVAIRASGRHRLRICMRVSDDFLRLAGSAILPALLLLHFIGPAERVLWLGAVSAGLLVTTRAALYAALRAAHRADSLTEPVLIVGNGRQCAELVEALQQHPDLGLRPVRCVGGGHPRMRGCQVETMSETADLIANHGIGRVIVSFQEGSDEELVPALRAQLPTWVNVYLVPRMHELANLVPAGCLDEVRGIPLMPLRHSGLRAGDRLVKRTFDLAVGTALLVALMPLLVILMVAQVLSCGRPVLFRQSRVTRAGRIVSIIKLRTLSCADPDSEWSAPADSCSPVGRWLRSTHLDELPQLFNVIRGDISLVGPRPERPHFASRFAEVIPRYQDRHRADAGITGWAQVHGLTGDTSISERVRFDNYYIEHWSLWLDLLILVRTLAEPLSGMLRARRASARPGP
jgi:exopolysaccharide biosynthesis polyprenyl glycosylphosphotransferase